MHVHKLHLSPLLLLLWMLVSANAHAQWAVIDVHAIAQLTQQVQTLQQALATARGQLQQAQAQLQAITGTRGMQNLLSGVVRNYLPVSSSELTNALNQVNSGYAALSAAVQAAAQNNAILSPQQLASFSPQEQAALGAVRNTVALLQGITGSALSNSSDRFAALQQLITAIPTATDQKGILDLQARIGAEQGMLQNEQTKLQVLYQALQAQQWSVQQQTREQIIAGHGQFETRFQPAP